MKSFLNVEAAIVDIKEGKMLIVLDDESRENEGDLVMAASKVTPEAINFMAKEGRGLICAPVSGEIADRLELLPMVIKNNDPFYTNFTVSIDLREGTTTGISASDRAKTIMALADETKKPSDFIRPGHIFPLRAQDEGVLKRPGHTEAAVDLCRFAGLPEAGVICEIADEDGEMARLPFLKRYAQKHGLRILFIQELIEYRRSLPSSAS